MGCPFHQQQHRVADEIGGYISTWTAPGQGFPCLTRWQQHFAKRQCLWWWAPRGRKYKGLRFGECCFQKTFLLKMQGVSWHCSELACRTAELFPVRVDMTFMCLSHYPPCFIRDLLIWQNAEYYGHEIYLSSWRTGSCYKDQFQPRLGGWSPLWVKSVCWRVHPFFHLPIIVPLVRPLALWTVVLLLCLGAVVRGFI